MPSFFHRPAAHDIHAPSLELEGVSVAYDGIAALEDVSFSVRQGDQAAVIGPNGAGKSTLFNVIAGIVKPQRAACAPSRRAGHICVGYVPQRNRIDLRFPVSVHDVAMMGRIGKIGLFAAGPVVATSRSSAKRSNRSRCSLSPAARSANCRAGSSSASCWRALGPRGRTAPLGRAAGRAGHPQPRSFPAHPRPAARAASPCSSPPTT